MEAKLWLLVCYYGSGSRVDATWRAGVILERDLSLNVKLYKVQTREVRHRLRYKPLTWPFLPFRILVRNLRIPAVMKLAILLALLTGTQAHVVLEKRQAPAFCSKVSKVVSASCSPYVTGFCSSYIKIPLSTTTSTTSTSTVTASGSTITVKTCVQIHMSASICV